MNCSLHCCNDIAVYVNCCSLPCAKVYHQVLVENVWSWIGWRVNCLDRWCPQRCYKHTSFHHWHSRDDWSSAGFWTCKSGLKPLDCTCFGLHQHWLVHHLRMWRLDYHEHHTNQQIPVLHSMETERQSTEEQSQNIQVGLFLSGRWIPPLKGDKRTIAVIHGYMKSCGSNTYTVLWCIVLQHYVHESMSMVTKDTLNHQ